MMTGEFILVAYTAPGRGSVDSMCGIVGFINGDGTSNAIRIKEMIKCLRHRGPDEQDSWTDSRNEVVLGHARLAIVDLSAAGHQPMISASGRYVLVYNGEIYNHGVLSKELSNLGHRFKGHSDTEVANAAFEEWGIFSATEKFNGQFAFAVLDTRENVLHLGRDRFGEKPLYYGWLNNSFFFASELKALKPHPSFTPEIDPSGLELLLRYAYIPSPHSIYKGIFKLLPGSILSVKTEFPQTPPSSFTPLASDKEWSPRLFWSLKELSKMAPNGSLSESQEIARTEQLLIESVQMRMVADVPLGAFLSGGVDSSTIVALMQKLSAKTYSYIFDWLS